MRPLADGCGGAVARDARKVAAVVRSILHDRIDRTRVATLRHAVERGQYIADCTLVADGLLGAVHWRWRH